MTDQADAPLMSFTSHIDGKNATITLYGDRIEWRRKSIMSTGAKAALGAATMGMSLLATGVKGKDEGNMVLIKAVQGVTTKKGLMNTQVTVSAGASSVAFNCSHGEAEGFKRNVLMLLR